MKKLNCLARNFALHYPRFIYQNGGETLTKAPKQSPKDDPVEKLDPAKATDLLKDPAKLDEFIQKTVKVDLVNQKYMKPEHVTKALVAKIMTDQVRLEQVANARLTGDMAKLNEHFVLSSVLKYINQPDDFFKKIVDNGNIQSYHVKEAALSRIKDLSYKVQKIKGGIAELTEAKEKTIDTAGSKTLDVSDNYYAARDAIRSIKDKPALQDLLTTAQVIKTQSDLAKSERQYLVELIEDQMKN